jgi:hypothetical protein
MKIDKLDAGDHSKNSDPKTPAKTLATGPRTEMGTRLSTASSRAPSSKAKVLRNTAPSFGRYAMISEFRGPPQKLSLKS